MNFDPNLIAQLLFNALQIPHIAVLVGMLSVLILSGWVFISFARIGKNR